MLFGNLGIIQTNFVSLVLLLFFWLFLFSNLYVLDIFIFLEHVDVEIVVVFRDFNVGLGLLSIFIEFCNSIFVIVLTELLKKEVKLIIWRCQNAENFLTCQRSTIFGIELIRNYFVKNSNFASGGPTLLNLKTKIDVWRLFFWYL